MQKFIKELEQLVEFKDSTEPGDIVLIAAKEPQMLMYAMVTEVERDPSRKDEWWHVHLSVLSLPIQEVTWTLRTPQMTGQEVFTMGGEERFIKAVSFKAPAKTVIEPGEKKKEPTKIKPFKRVK